MVYRAGTSEIGGSRAGSLTCGTTSLVVLEANGKRRQAVLVNDSDTPIYLSFGDAPAVVNAGVRLNANGGVCVIKPDNTGRIWTGAIQAISSAANKILCWSEDW